MIVYCDVLWYTMMYCDILCILYVVYCGVHLFFQVHGAHDSESGTAVGPAGPDGDENAT